MELKLHAGLHTLTDMTLRREKTLREVLTDKAYVRRCFG